MKRNCFWKKALKKAGMLFVSFMIIGNLTGCGIVNTMHKMFVDSEPKSETVEQENVVCIVSSTSNEPLANVSSLKEEFKKMAMAGGTVTIIEADGAPYLVDVLNVSKQKDDIPKKKREEIAEKQAEQIMDIIQQCIPKTAEMDLLKAIQMAARALEDSEGNKKLLIHSSGLSTTSLVDFTELMLEADHSEQLVENLEENNAIPDLSSVDVYWTGLGETISPQTELYDSNRKILRDTWESILTAANTTVDFKNELSVEMSTGRESIPDTSVVPIAKPASLWDEGDFSFDMNANGAEDDDMTYVFNDEKISFKPGSAKLRTSEKAVRNIFSKLIDYMQDNPEYKILLVGTTASFGTDEELNSLSYRRCQTIKKILIKAGVNEKQMICMGLGYKNNFTQKDTNENGKEIKKVAMKNRAVYVKNANSKSSQKLIAQIQK